jgi:hypothetical protein
MTRRLLMFLALVGFAAPQLLTQTPQQTPAAQPAGFGTVQGTIVREGTTDPIPDVQITIVGRGGMSSAEGQNILNAVARGSAVGLPPEMLQAAQEAARGGQAPLTATSDGSGNFTIRNVPAGTVNLRAQLEGYFGPSLNGNYPSIVSTPVTVTPNQNSNVKISMLPGGTVSGRVLDTNGRPLSEAPVQILRSAYENGKPSFQTFNFKTTDDRGEYRMYRLAPGEYYLAVNPRPGGARGGTATNSQETPVTTFYPNATDPSLALPIKVRSGDDLSGMNIQMRTAIGAKVSGRVTSTVPAGSLTGARGQVRTPAIALVPQATRGMIGLNGAGAIAANPDDGSFEIPNVPPGIYDLLARFPIETLTGWGPQNPPGLATGPWAFGRTTVEVRGSDVENVAIVIRKGTDVKGRLVIDGKPSAANVRVTLQPEDGAMNANDGPMANTFAYISSYQAPIAPDGSFTLPLIPEGRYRFQVVFTGAPTAGAPGAVPAGVTLVAAAPGAITAANAAHPALPQTSYVADIRQGGVSVYDDGLVVGQQVNPIDVLINTSSGSLEGTVLNPDQKPAAGMAVILIPEENRRQNAALYRNTRSNPDGRFTMANVPPGRYTVYAWESIAFGAYQNAEFMAKYTGRGTGVIVQAGARASVNVNAIREDDSRR